MNKLCAAGLVCFLAVGVAVSLPFASFAKEQGKKEQVHKVKKDEGAQARSEEAASSSTPPGWSRGRKTGWGGGSYPPGWSKWDKKEQERWVSDRKDSEQEINDVLVRYEVQEFKRNEIIGAFDQAIVGGAAINESRKKLVDALKDGKARRGLMVDTTQQVLDLLR